MPSLVVDDSSSADAVEQSRSFVDKSAVGHSLDLVAVDKIAAADIRMEDMMNSVLVLGQEDIRRLDKAAEPSVDFDNLA